MKVLELFCGTKSISKVFEERGHETFTIDFDKQFNPDLCIDILDFDIKMLPKEFRNPTVIWASPPCTSFSVASISKYWKNKQPKSYKTYIGLAIAKKTVEIIEELKPKYWFIENPRGMLRKQIFMQNLHRNTVTYCKYGFEYMKATDIWTNNINWNPKQMCKKGDPCHIRAVRGSRKGVQGIQGRPGRIHNDWGYAIDRSSGAALKRSVLPKDLCNEIVKSCEQKQKIKQETLN